MGLLDSAIGGITSFAGGIAGNAVGSGIGSLSQGMQGAASQNHFTATAPNLGDQTDEERRAALAAQLQQGQNQYASGSGVATSQAQQQAALNQLQQESQGKGVNVGQQVMQAGVDQNVSAANAAAASSKGNVNPALLQRNVAQTAANANQQAAQQGAILGSQQQLAATNQLVQGQQVATGQDIQIANQVNQLAAQYQQMGLSADQAQLQAQMQAQQINSGVAQQNAQAQNQLLGGVLSAGGQAGAMAASDEKLKKDVSDGKPDINQFLNDLSAHRYKYKQPEMDGKGDRYSPMAQELEKSKVGKTMVVDTPRGKMVDYGAGFGAILAAQAALNERLKALETRKRA